MNNNIGSILLKIISVLGFYRCDEFKIETYFNHLFIGNFFNLILSVYVEGEVGELDENLYLF